MPYLDMHVPRATHNVMQAPWTQYSMPVHVPPQSLAPSILQAPHVGMTAASAPMHLEDPLLNSEPHLLPAQDSLALIMMQQRGTSSTCMCLDQVLQHQQAIPSYKGLAGLLIWLCNCAGTSN